MCLPMHEILLGPADCSTSLKRVHCRFGGLQQAIRLPYALLFLIIAKRMASGLW